MKKIALAALLGLCTLPALAEVTVADAWVRATVPAQKATGAVRHVKADAEAPEGRLEVRRPDTGVTFVEGAVAELRDDDRLTRPVWLPPLPEDELTDRHCAGLVDAARAKSPYFRLLARDPDTLGARTRSDKDIFYNPDAGLPRAERELSATATLRFNGCIYCASVHARFASHFSHREGDVQRLLDEGVSADLGPRWNAIVAASAALSATPSDFGPEHIDGLRAVGLDDYAIADALQGAAFCNCANRLMLSLGGPQWQVGG